MHDDFLIIIAVIAVLIFIFSIATIYRFGFEARKRIEQLERYEYITLGMPEAKMLQIMGEGYNRSLLKNGRKKYEWRINASSGGYSSNGISSRVYSGVKKVTIYVKDGVVEEVRPYNV